MDVKYALKNPTELFCEKARRLSAVGKTTDTAKQVKLGETSGQKILARNYKLWRDFKNNIQDEIKKVAIQGKYFYNIPLKNFPIYKKINEWAIENGFNVFITTDRNLGAQEENFEYIDSLAEDRILDGKIYFLMTIDWTVKDD